MLWSTFLAVSESVIFCFAKYHLCHDIVTNVLQHLHKLQGYVTNIDKGCEIKFNPIHV